MNTNELLDRVQAASDMSEIVADDIRDYLSGLQGNLADSPLDAAAYAGTARCREMLGGDPKTILDYYVLSLTLDEQNKNVWAMLGEFATRRAGKTQTNTEAGPGLPTLVERNATSAPVFQAGNKVEDIIARIKIRGQKKLLFFVCACLLLTYIVIYGAVQS